LRDRIVVAGGARVPGVGRGPEGSAAPSAALVASSPLEVTPLVSRASSAINCGDRVSDIALSFDDFDVDDAALREDDECAFEGFDCRELCSRIER